MIDAVLMETIQNRVLTTRHAILNGLLLGVGAACQGRAAGAEEAPATGKGLHAQVASQSDGQRSSGVEAPGKPRRRAGRKLAPHCTPAGADRLIAQDRVHQRLD